MERSLKPVRAGGIERKVVDFTFFPDGVTTTELNFDAGTLVSPGGLVEKVTPDGAGEFLCTLRDSGYRVASKHASVQMNANNVNLDTQFGPISNVVPGDTTTPLTVVVRTKAAGANAAPPAANANNSVSVQLWLEDSASSAGVP